MGSICFFASYFTENAIPYYVEVYLSELKKHFDTVVLISTQKTLTQESLNYLDSNGIDSINQSNEGYDFGLWYKAFQIYDVSGYEKIALVNDSCILFKPLDEFIAWSENDRADLQGITFSEAVSKHIQSYFLIINKKAIEPVKSYFSKHKVLKDIQDVITVYEIGLSSELQAQGLSINAFVDNDGYAGEFSPYYQCIDHHLQKGIPVIKKKILYASYRSDELFTLARMNFNISHDHYVNLIKSYNKTLLIDFDKLQAGATQKMSSFGKIKYNLTRIFLQIFRPIYKIVKK